MRRNILRSRAEHIKFCKEEAYKQYDFDMSGHKDSEPDKAIKNACTTMLCDLSKHPETEGAAKACVFLVFTVDDLKSMKRFIDGFN